jgi:CBS domain-containing protein
MRVSQILSAKGDAVFTATPKDTVDAICALLHVRRIGAMVILDGDRIAGIVSERDIVRALAQEGATALTRPVSGIMTPEVHLAGPDDSVDELLEIMTDRRIRHLPVWHTGKLLGIVSIGDLVKSKISEVEAEADGLKAYIAAG